jgi:hypothetical protein
VIRAPVHAPGLFDCRISTPFDSSILISSRVSSIARWIESLVRFVGDKPVIQFDHDMIRRALSALKHPFAR